MHCEVIPFAVDYESLSYALAHGIVDDAYIQAQVEQMKREEYLKKHQYKIWQGNDGKWYTYYMVDDTRKLKKRNSKRELEDLIISFIKEDEINPTIADVFNEWNDRRRDMNKISSSSHLRYKKLFEKHYAEFGDKRIKNIQPEEVVDFLEEQIPKYHMSAKSFSNLKTITKGMMKRAKRRKLISWNIEEAMYSLDVSDVDFKRRIKEDYEEVYNDEEREQMISYLSSNPDLLNLGILLLFATGMRVGELMALTPQDIPDYNTVCIRRTETCYCNDDGSYQYTVKDFPKTTAGVRTIVIPNQYSWVLKTLKLQNPFGEYVFMKNGKRMTVRALEARLRRVCKKLGIYPKSPHKIRKTYGSILLDNNVDSRMILDQMGHTDLTTTERFYHRNRRKIDSKIEILDGLPEFAQVITK